MLTSLVVTALATPALAQSPADESVHLPPDLDGVIRAERARSGEIFQRLDQRALPTRTTPERQIPSVTITPGNVPDPSVIAERYRATQSHPASSGPELLIFVSFSMPHPSLVRLAEQAHAAKAVLVFRGLAGATLRQMVDRLQPLARTGVAMQINPEAFTRFAIEIVPTFVLAVGGTACGEQSCEAKVRRVAGDVSLDHALERLAGSSDSLMRAAEARLRQLRGSEQ